MPERRETRRLVPNSPPGEGVAVPRHAAEHEIEALRAELASYRRFFSLSPDLLCIAGFDGYFKELSPSWSTTLGYGLDELMARPYVEFVHPDDNQETLVEAHALTDGTYETLSFINRYRHRDGGYRWLEWAAVTDPESQRIHAVAKDVTRRIEMERRLFENEQKFRQLAEGNRDVCWVLDITDSRRTWDYVSPAYQDLSGRTLAELYSDPEVWLRDVHPSDRDKVRNAWRALATEGYDIEYRVLGKAGRGLHWVRDRVYSMEHRGDSVRVIGITEDITERKRAERDLVRSKDLAESANRTKSAFLATMSHEMRTPLHAIVGFTELLSSRCDEFGDPEMCSALGAIRQSTELLTGLVDSTLELALIESGRMDVKREPCNLRKLVASLRRAYHLLLQQEDLEFECTIDDDIPEYVVSDSGCLHRILANLLSNAIKFSPQGKRIWLRIAREREHLLLQIRDQGIGIQTDKLDEIFDKFMQADNTATRRYGGTGLGLAITKEIVELLHGTIAVQSVPGEGSTFSIWLPCVEPETPVGLLEENTPEPVALPRFSGVYRVLLVEDNPINRKVASGLFQRLGLDIELASNGQEGVRRASELHPDIIFMDIHMPVMGGLEAARRIRADPDLADIPIIALSADAFLGRDEIVQRSGITEYLTKPLLLQQLATTLRTYLPLDQP